MKPTSRFLAPAVLSGMALCAVAAIASAQDYPRAPDQSRSVAGWTVEDLAEPGEEELDRRVIRMTREVGGNRVAYEVYPHGYSGAGGFDARSGGGCFSIHGVDVEAEGDARLPAVRAALASALEAFEDICEEAEGSAPELLEGFEPAYAQLAEWRAVRVAEYEAQLERYDMENAAEMAEDMNAVGCAGNGC